jgi:uncharacterized protein YdeI (YjbR/CyaY-like superfamily)
VRTLTVKDRKEWATWLRAHHRTAKEIWLVYYRKASGKPRIAYNDAVEEALRFGWIDSQQKGIDADRFAQRFSPRRPGSPWSEMNKARLRRLIAAGKMSAAGLAAAKDVRLHERFVVPRDIAAAIRADPAAARAFRALPRQYAHIRIGFINAARNRPAEFRKRLRYFITMTAKGKTFGYVKEFAGSGRGTRGARRNDPR